MKTWKKYSASYRKPETSHSINLLHQGKLAKIIECLKIRPMNQTSDSSWYNWSFRNFSKHELWKITRDIFGTLWSQTSLPHSDEAHLGFPGAHVHLRASERGHVFRLSAGDTPVISLMVGLVMFPGSLVIHRESFDGFCWQSLNIDNGVSPIAL